MGTVCSNHNKGFNMTSHAGILYQLYDELIGNRWELSGAEEYPQDGYYFTPTCLMGLWASLRFGIHDKKSKFVQSATLRLYDPSETKDVASGLYFELQAFDAPRFSESYFQVFVGKGADSNMRIWSNLVLEQARALEVKATYARVIELVLLRSFSLWVSEICGKFGEVRPILAMPDSVRSLRSLIG